jgi:prepilin-type processing-associated H-X9-DG protein
VILPYVEQANLYNLFNFAADVNSSSTNAAARDQEVPIYICPSDGSSATLLDPGGSGKNAGRANYRGNVGATADQHSTNGALVGVFNFTYSANGQVSSKVTILSITDGTSNTAMFSETTRSMNTSSDYDPTMIYLIPSTDSGWSVLTPMTGPSFNETSTSALIQGSTYHCNSWDYGPTSIIRYRGLEYYRALPEMNQYTHTVPPNYHGYDCGDDSSFTMAHIAARSYHTNGVNISMSDGSVRYISNSIDFPTWQAIGTRSGGEVINGTY